MALKIKLTKGGAKNNPHFSIVITEARSKRDGQFIEKVGHYHPTVAKSDPNRVVANIQRIKYWVSVGALPTNTVTRIVSTIDSDLLKQFLPEFKQKKYYGISKKKVIEIKKEEAKVAAEAKKAKVAALKAAAEQENNKSENS